MVTIAGQKKLKFDECHCTGKCANTRDCFNKDPECSDSAAKDAAAQQTKETMCTLLSDNNLDICFSLQSMQTFDTGQTVPSKIMAMDEFG